MACKTQRRRSKKDSASHRAKKSQNVKPLEKIDPITLGDSMQDFSQENYVPPYWALPKYRCNCGETLGYVYYW